MALHNEELRMIKYFCVWCKGKKRKLYEYKGKTYCEICLQAELRLAKCYFHIESGKMYINLAIAYKDLGAKEIEQ